MGDVASGTGPQHEGISVSVVVPVHDAMPYLESLLRPLAAQDLDETAFEVILVDDGSTDGGPAVLDAWAGGRPRARVVHQDNSGWPGRPRNRGLDLARGRYVSLAEADDELGPEALRRMVEFADEHGSDVLVPRSVGVGRSVPHLFRATRVDADLERVFHTLTPQRLFRRSFLEREQLRFPEEKVRLEDGMMLARAYLLADRVSYLGGYAFYRLTLRDDGRNISSQTIDPDGYTWSVAEVSRLVREHDPDPGRADRIVLDLYRRKCLNHYRPARWAETSPERRRQFLAAH
ncbi:putative glycosyl transferase [Serinicoccus hydrothermalis]|uniref:Putative glycosyl transferase n=1 Tax=Serinicoccus hydrothermalis TaxID=1758689 RepID=A0A1B1NB12_9MICO|nr:glycosyltransferase family 2 protein [Serinicoccus hydrothermalis]ANS78617.1 putative glycosyl transferase [Serinicoccus hydrothermalis]